MFDFRVLGGPVYMPSFPIFSKIDHNTIGNIRIPVRKYKIVSKLDVLPAVILGFGLHRMDVGIMRSDGTIDADTLFYVDAIEKFSIIDLAVLILTHGTGNLIKTALDVASKADAIRASIKMFADKLQTVNPDISEWDSKWTDFKRARFNHPLELVGIGRSIDWTCKASMLSALTIGFGWNGFSFYGVKGGIRLLVPDPDKPIAPLKSLLNPIFSPPGKDAPIAEISSWSYICKTPANPLVKLLLKSNQSTQSMMDFELSDYIGELSRTQGIGIWCSVEQTRDLVENHILPWFEQVSSYIENKFDEIIEYLISIKEQIAHGVNYHITRRSQNSIIESNPDEPDERGNYHIIKKSQNDIVEINHDKSNKNNDLDYQRIYSPGQAPLEMK